MGLRTMLPIVIIVAAFVGVATLVGGVAVMFRGAGSAEVEDRLDLITGRAEPVSLAEKRAQEGSLLSQPLDDHAGRFVEYFSKFGNLFLLLEQADSKLTPSKFLLLTGLLGGGAAVASVASGLHAGLAPIIGLVAATLPLVWLIFKRKRRLANFAKQLPDALELIARALRAGHSLASGFHLVSDEMTAPISQEFGRVFEEQNLGVPLEDALNNLGDRVPNLDLRFFCTAVILQRTTGGDLAEILDKIGHLVRERFKIWGQVQALTGEGRLSGIVLLALPPVLFLTMFRLNKEYVMTLFTDPLGTQMLAFAVVTQVLGALVIRKIINIKV